MQGSTRLERGDNTVRTLDGSIRTHFGRNGKFVRSFVKKEIVHYNPRLCFCLFTYRRDEPTSRLMARTDTQRTRYLDWATELLGNIPEYGCGSTPSTFWVNTSLREHRSSQTRRRPSSGPSLGIVSRSVTRHPPMVPTYGEITPRLDFYLGDGFRWERGPLSEDHSTPRPVPDTTFDTKDLDTD